MLTIELPYKYAVLAFKRMRENKDPNYAPSIRLSDSFYFADTPEGYHFWVNLDNARADTPISDLPKIPYTRTKKDIESDSLYEDDAETMILENFMTTFELENADSLLSAFIAVRDRLNATNDSGKPYNSHTHGGLCRILSNLFPDNNIESMRVLSRWRPFIESKLPNFPWRDKNIPLWFPANDVFSRIVVCDLLIDELKTIIKFWNTENERDPNNAKKCKSSYKTTTFFDLIFAQELRYIPEWLTTLRGVRNTLLEERNTSGLCNLIIHLTKTRRFPLNRLRSYIEDKLPHLCWFTPGSRFWFGVRDIQSRVTVCDLLISELEAIERKFE